MKTRTPSKIMSTERRIFLKQAGVILTGLTLFKNILNASTANPSDSHFFILFQVDGGMDVTLGLDPKFHQNGTTQNQLFIEYNRNEIVKEKNLLFAPAAYALRPFANDLVVINGVYMPRDAGHDALRDYMKTGSGNNSHADFSIELEATKNRFPLGVLIDKDPLFGQRAIALSNLNVLKDDLSSSTLKNQFESDVNVILQGLSLNSTLPVNSYIKIQDSRAKFVKASEEIKKLATDYSPTELSVASAFSAGLASRATISISPQDGLSLDTHSDHVKTHLRAQTSVWSQIANYFKLFKSIPFKNSSLFDSTTFVVVTEFSRTPFLNTAKGKDHNPLTNSVLIAGKNIQGGQTVGASVVWPTGPDGSSVHIGAPLDFKSGLVVKNTQAVNEETVALIKPEHLAKTIGAIFENPADFYKDLKSYPVIPGVVKLRVT